MKQSNPTIPVVGVTGGMGSGKSVVLQFLEKECGFEVISSDAVGHDLMVPGQTNYQWMVAQYGRGILQEDGTINTRAVASLVFSDPEKVRTLNAAVHPVIKKEIIRRIDDLRRDGNVRGIALESALLSEGNLTGLCDEIWYVRCPKNIRISRVMHSRGYSRSRAVDTIRRQKSDHAFLQEADRVIANGGTTEDLHRRVSHQVRALLSSDPWKGVL